MQLVQIDVQKVGFDWSRMHNFDNVHRGFDATQDVTDP